MNLAMYLFFSLDREHDKRAKMFDDDPEQGEGRGQGLRQGRGPQGQSPGTGQTSDRRKCQVSNEEIKK